MASANGFTTEAKVKSRLKNFNSLITSGEVDTFITHAEGLVIAVSKIKWVSTGSSTIPALVEAVTTDLAALYLLGNDPSGFKSVSEAAFIADILWAQSQRGLKYLQDETIIEQLKEATKN